MWCTYFRLYSSVLKKYLSTKPSKPVMDDCPKQNICLNTRFKNVPPARGGKHILTYFLAALIRSYDPVPLNYC